MRKLIIYRGYNWQAVTRFCALLFGLILSGCASVTYTPVQNDNDADGLRYYDTSPYLLITKDVNQQWNCQLIYLQDQTKEYQATVWAFLAQNNSSFTFSTNGVLTGTTSSLDTTVIPNALLTAVASVAGSAVKLASVNGNQLANLLTHYNVALFKIVKTNGD